MSFEISDKIGLGHCGLVCICICCGAHMTDRIQAWLKTSLVCHFTQASSAELNILKSSSEALDKEGRHGVSRMSRNERGQWWFL